jgi:hypothetical protein
MNESLFMLLCENEYAVGSGRILIYSSLVPLIVFRHLQGFTIDGLALCRLFLLLPTFSVFMLVPYCTEVAGSWLTRRWRKPEQKNNAPGILLCIAFHWTTWAVWFSVVAGGDLCFCHLVNG